jgi:hypothetical protein
VKNLSVSPKTVRARAALTDSEEARESKHGEMSWGDVQLCTHEEEGEEQREDSKDSEALLRDLNTWRRPFVATDRV